MALSPDLEKRELPGGNTSKPESGTYGEKAALANLESSLPMDESHVEGQDLDPMPRQPEGLPGIDEAGRPPSGPPGLPSALLHPTELPGVDVNTPLQPAPTSGMASAVDDRQRRLLVLTDLAESPDTSEATREWAKILIELLTS